ncbi:MAG TPA: hypothetical protein P5260_15845 [Candidatus Competibacter sp.]|nr:hypothetical protein [Candidatus Competibacter sp.]HRX62668.1 hypothetical protein [Candidatus Competibacter sp.]
MNKPLSIAALALTASLALTTSLALAQTHLTSREPTKSEMVEAMMAKFYAHGGALAPAVGVKVTKISKVGCNRLSQNRYRCAYQAYYKIDCDVNPIMCFAGTMVNGRTNTGIFTKHGNTWSFGGAE